ncbi:MAG: hypothetical protein AAF743_02975 [Planctomycetota bacterium]
MSTIISTTMITTTTYGTWLPGDIRGYVDDGTPLPHDPQVLGQAQRKLQIEPVHLSREQQDRAFAALRAACTEFNYWLVAASFESWHVHLLVQHGDDAIATVAGRLKNRMRQAVNHGRIWSSGYDARFCYNDRQLIARRDYINAHRGARTLPTSHH